MAFRRSLQVQLGMASQCQCQIEQRDVKWNEHQGRKLARNHENQFQFQCAKIIQSGISLIRRFALHACAAINSIPKCHQHREANKASPRTHARTCELVPHVAILERQPAAFAVERGGVLCPSVPFTTHIDVDYFQRNRREGVSAKCRTTVVHRTGPCL